MNARVIEGFCTDCAAWTPLHDGRCGCGSGRVAVPPAGYRILGPDEVDPVTVEKAAEAAENASIRVSYGILSQERDEPILHRTAIASLIRALGRKA